MTLFKYSFILFLFFVFVPILNAQNNTILEVPHTRTFPGIENSAFPYMQPEEMGLSSKSLRKLSNKVAKWVSEEKVIGAEIMVTKDQKIVLHEAIGWNDREAGQPMSRNSIFRLLAMTKPFTGTAVMMLIENGTLELDTRVSRWIPSWDNDRSANISVHHLLTHTSGYEQYGTPKPIHNYSSLRSAVDDAGQKGPQHKPGEASRYSDVNSYALGALVEEATGISVEQFIQKRILDPLDLNDTYTGFAPDSSWAERVNSRYRYIDGTWKKVWTPAQKQADPFFRASGGLFSTVSNYTRWLHIWMNWANVAFLSESSTDLHGSREEGMPQLLSDEMIRTALSNSEGPLHWRIMSVDPLVFGHHGIDGTHGLAIPSLGITVVYFTQTQGKDLRGQWMRAALEAVAPDVEFYRPIPSVPIKQADLNVVELPQSQKKMYTGKYTSGQASLNIYLDEGRLKRILPIAGSPEVILVPLKQNHTFAMGRYDGELLTEILLPLQQLRFVVNKDHSTAVELIHDGKVREVLQRSN